MKNCFIIFLFFLIPGIVNSQESRERVRKAFDYYNACKMDSAIILFREVYALEDSSDKTSALSVIGDIHKKKSQIDSAKYYYERVLRETQLNDHFEIYYASNNLADIAIDRKQFSTALKYLKNAELHKNGLGCSMGGWDRAYDRCYKFTLAFDGLNEVDSAIKYLTRFMFQSPTTLFYYPKKDSTRSWFYYRLLLKKYDACEIRDELDKSMTDLYYTVTPKTSNGQTMMIIESYLNFLGSHIPILNVGVGGMREEDMKYYSKEACIEYVTGSVLYRIITNAKISSL